MPSGFIIEGVTAEQYFSKIREIIKEEIQNSLNDSKKTPEQSNEYLTRNEVKILTRCSLPTIDRLTSSGVLKGYRFGPRRILYRADEVNAALKEIDTLKYKHS